MPAGVTGATSGLVRAPTRSWTLATFATAGVVAIGATELSALTVPRSVLLFCLLVLVVFLHLLYHQLIAAGVRTATLESLARTDALTEIPNRRGAEDLLTEQLARRARYGDMVSLLMIDVDHFKHLNDRHGHDAGDAALQALVAILRSEMRSLDTLVRWGGDELMVIAPSTDPRGAAVSARRWQQHLQRLRPGGEPLTLSIGIAIPQPSDTVKQWVQRADAAMYAAKARGGNHTHIDPASLQAPHVSTMLPTSTKQRTLV